MCRRRFASSQLLDRHKELYLHKDPPPAAPSTTAAAPTRAPSAAAAESSSSSADSSVASAEHRCAFCDALCESEAVLKSHENDCQVAREIVASRNVTPTLTKKKVKTVCRLTFTCG